MASVANPAAAATAAAPAIAPATAILPSHGAGWMATSAGAAALHSASVARPPSRTTPADAAFDPTILASTKATDAATAADAATASDAASTANTTSADATDATADTAAKSNRTADTV